MGRYTEPLGFSTLFPFCGLPLRVDPYRGCGFSCSYCFARARESTEGTPQVQAADAGLLTRYFRRVFDEQRTDLSIVTKCIRQRIPLQLGAMGDPFQPAEQRHRVTLSYLRATLAYEYPIVISTRGTLVAESPYLEILKAVVRMSLSTTEDARSSLIEQQLVRPSSVLRTMERVSAAGVRVACRWQPFVPGVSEEPETFASRVAATGCQQCSFEFLRLPRERRPQLIAGFYKATGENIYRHYRALEPRHQVREYILPPEERIPMILRARRAIRAEGTRFGAADNDLQYLSDDACCCSGVDAVPGFERFFKHQIAYAVRNNFGNAITYAAIRHEWTPSGSVDRYLNSARRIGSRIGRSATVREHIKRRWNRSGLEGSPDSFFGVEPTSERTPDGMRVYRWNPAKIAALRQKINAE